jgi:L-methionine (R)-S-oxide reductase
MKQDAYRKLLKRLESQIVNERDWLANLSNSAQLFGKLVEDVNWIGFYLFRQDHLILGPFFGNPAVTRIKLGSGVCGTAARERRAIIVPDVHAFEGHIVCDIISQSEIVIPFYDQGRLLGVLDVDSPTLARFDDEDLEGFCALLDCLVTGTDWPVIV